MASWSILSWKLLLAVALFQHYVSGDSLMGGHLDNKDDPGANDEQSMSRTRGTELDLDLDPGSNEDVPSPSALISDGLQYRMPGLFAFNGGKPFSLEKDPITGKIDFDKAPLKTLNYTVDNTNATDYSEYDEESYVTDVQSDDIYDKKNIDRKDGSIDGTRPNEINPYSPSFHDFLNLPVHYSSGKYSKEKYPLISSSYANTKVQSGLNSYNTYNHRPYVDAEVTASPPLYYATHKTYLPKTTVKPATTLKPSSTWSTSPSTTTSTTTTTTTTTTTAATTKVTTTQKPSTTSTTVPSTETHLPPTWKPTTYSPTKPSSTKPPTIYSSLKPQSTKTATSYDNHFDSILGDSFGSFKPMPADTGYSKNPTSSNVPVSHNSHARPTIIDDYGDNYDYDSAEDGYNDDPHDKSPPITSSTTTTPPSSTLSMSIGTTVKKQQPNGTMMEVNDHSLPKPGSSNFSTHSVNTSAMSFSQTVSTGPPPTSLPLGDNHPEKPFQPLYVSQSSVENRKPPMDTAADRTGGFRKPESGGNPIRFFEHPILNNINPDSSLNVNSRPYDIGNGYVRPSHVSPNGMQQVESASSVIIPPGQDTVSFVLGNQQNVDSGHFVGSAVRESPYVAQSEGSFRPLYAAQNTESRPPQAVIVPKKPATNIPVALASVGVNTKPLFMAEVGQSKPTLSNNNEKYGFNFNPQNRPYLPKINGVEPPNPNPLPSFVNPPPPYIDISLNNPSATVSSGSPVRFDITNPQSGPSENSLNLGVRTSLNTPSLNVGTRPFRDEGLNIRNVQAEASLKVGVRPFSESSSSIDRTQNQDDAGTVSSNSNENSNQGSQSGYVVFPGNSQDRPVEEHVIVINEADGSVQEFSPTIKGTPVLDRPQELPDNLPKLSESLTPPEKPIDRPLERPSGSYPPRPLDGRPRPYYPQRPDYLRPPRLPPHSKQGISDGSFKRPPLDSKLPNILPQFRPNAKSSHGHHGSELIGTIPAPYGPGRQPILGRRPPPQYLQRLSPPPPPVHALRLVSEGEPGFREPSGKEGQKYEESFSVNDRYRGNPTSDNQRYRNPVSESLKFSNPFPEKERFQDQGSPLKRFHTPPSQNERFQGFSSTEGDQFSEQKSSLRRNAEKESEGISSFERFSVEPPQIPSRPLINRRSSVDYKDGPQVTTLQMIQQQGGLNEKVVKPNLPPPFRVKFNKDEEGSEDDEVADSNDDREEKRPVYVVYPVNSATNVKDDTENEDETVVVGTRGPHRPLPPDTLPSGEDEDAVDGIALPVLRDRPLLRPQNKPYSGPTIKSDFPYPLERPDPSLLIPHEKPLLIPNDKADEDKEDEDEDGEMKKHDDTSINLIPYLQDYMPFPMRKTETPALAAKPLKSENSRPLGDSDSRIISRPAESEPPLYRAPISATLKTGSATTVTPIAYAYTPTDDTLDYPELGIRPSELIEMVPNHSKEENANQNPVLPSQQPSSSSSSAPSPQNFMAPFLASVSAEAPSSSGWSVVSKAEANDRADVEEDKEETQTEQSEFDIENFKPQLFGGFKPIYEFPIDGDSNSKITESPDLRPDDN